MDLVMRNTTAILKLENDLNDATLSIRALKHDLELLERKFDALTLTWKSTP